MALDLLDTPLRVTWDLHDGRQGMDPGLARRVADRLTEAQAFFVTIDSRPLLHDDASALVDSLLASGCQVEVGTGSSAVEIDRCASLPAPVVATLDVAPWCREAGIDADGLCATIDRFRSGGRMPVCSLVPTGANLLFLQELFSLCQAAGVTRFKLPNLRIDDSFRKICQPRMVTPDDLERLRAQCTDAVAFRGDLQLDVHDLFLWELLFPDGGAQRSEYGGCQAGNSLAHVDLAGRVHPCVTWPQVLGDLGDRSFADIWASAARHQVRASIAQTPVGCDGCRDYAICFGGCRGLARELPTPDGRDPMCRGRR